jgi:hypothetical protein
MLGGVLQNHAHKTTNYLKGLEGKMRFLATICGVARFVGGFLLFGPSN